MAEEVAARPEPVIDPDSEAYWDFLRAHRMHVPRCLTCGATFLYPRSLCPRCAGTDVDWIPVSGRGRVWSYTVSRRASAPAFQDSLPLVVALVELDEGPRLLTNIVNSDPADIRVGQRVELVYLDLAATTVPLFRPADDDTPHPPTDGDLQ